MPAPTSINIGPYSFPLRAGYSTHAEGFAVGVAELETLDAVRAERVRKKAFKVFEKLRARSGRRTLSEGELRHLGTLVAEFDQEVRCERTGGGADAARSPHLAREGFAPPPDLTQGDFDAEVARLAGLRVAAEEQARGATLRPDVREAALAALRTDPLIREAARARVEATLAERERMLGELF